jgi:hypothetical protein
MSERSIADTVFKRDCCPGGLTETLSLSRAQARYGHG